MGTRSWVQCRETGKLIPKEEYRQPVHKSAYVQGDLESFVSPIDRSVITDRKQLRNHLKQHGVTRSEDYSKDFLHKRRLEREADMTGTTESARQERKHVIREELARRGL